MKIVLIGFACSYKTSVGKLLAQQLNMEWVDTDEMVTHYAKKSIAQIFVQDSELEFRRAESFALLEAAHKDNVVVSCGGGGALHSAFEKLACGAKVVWLTSTAATILSRLGGEPRPLLDGKSVEQIDELIIKRTPYYQKYANLTVATDGKTSEQVTDEIVSLLPVNM